MKFLRLPSMSVECIEMVVDTDPWLIRHMKKRLGIDDQHYTVRIPGRSTYSTGILQLERHDPTLPLGKKIPMLKDDVSGFIMYGIIPYEVMEDGLTLGFHIDHMVHESKLVKQCTG